MLEDRGPSTKIWINAMLAFDNNAFNRISPAAEGGNLAREYPQWVFADYASQDLPHQESE